MNFIVPKRKINKVYLHCSASDLEIYGKELVMEITKWHLARGFLGIGYHYIIDKSGYLSNGRNIELIPAAQEGHNTGSIAICVHGLKEFTDISLEQLKRFCKLINEAYNGNITFHGHCEVSDKSCPVYDYKKLLNLDEKGKMKND